MTVAIPITVSGDALSTYDGLIEALQAWLQSTAIGDRAPQLIYLAEAYFRREILSQSREGTDTLTASASVALPDDFLALRAAWLDTDPLQTLEPMSPNTAHTFRSTAATGRPQNYLIVGDNMQLFPAPDTTYSVKIIYDRSFIGLSETNATNWLIEDHPDAYLYGALIHAELFGWNDERIPLLKNALDEAVIGINKQGNRRRYATPLRIRSSVVERI